MRKAIYIAAAAAIAGAIGFKPAPASAFYIIAAIMENKNDKNFKAVNPYAPHKVKTAKKKKKK